MISITALAIYTAELVVIGVVAYWAGKKFGA